VSEENLTVARRWMDSYIAGDADALLACLTEDWELHEEDGSTTTRTHIAEITRVHAQAFPQKTVEYLHELADGDLVAHHARFSLVHTGRYYDIEPTGKRIELSEMVFHRFANGRIARSWRMTFPDSVYTALVSGAD
jgi:predicted ester cyclase